jgi:hypothetical protein
MDSYTEAQRAAVDKILLEGGWSTLEEANLELAKAASGAAKELDYMK